MFAIHEKVLQATGKSVYSTVAMIVGAVINIVLDPILIFGAVSTAAVTAYGIFYKIQQFIFFAGFGLRDAITPIVSFNYGRGSKKRVKEGIKYGMIYVEVIMLAGIILLQIFANPLVAVFGLTDETARLIALQGVFQALGCGISSLVVSLLRLLLIVLPLAKVFSMMSNTTDMIWFAIPIAELFALIVAVIF